MSIHDIISIQNIDDEDFSFEYDKAQGNYPYTIPAGEVKRFPRFLAAHAVKHLIDKVMTKRDQKLNNEFLRQQLANQIIIDEETFQQAPKKTEAEKLKEKVDRLNQPSELDSILKRRNEEAKKAIPVVPVKEETEVVEDKEEFEGLEPKTDKEPAKVEPIPEPETVKPVEDKPEDFKVELPDRDKLYDYAVNDLKIVLTPKTRASFDKLGIKELIKQLNYPLLGE